MTRGPQRVNVSVMAPKKSPKSQTHLMSLNSRAPRIPSCGRRDFQKCTSAIGTNSYGQREDTDFQIEFPKNLVVISGASVTLDCTENQPYRWYRYLPSKLDSDKVIYTGTKMADDVDGRFRVFTIPNKSPYERIHLLVSNVQPDLAGTYKCKGYNESYCAELVVLHSEPVCELHGVHKNGTNTTLELRCSFNVTSNGEPEMLCQKDKGSVKPNTICSRKFNNYEPLDVIVCSAKVADWLGDNFTCVIRINARPLQRYITCSHASNKPEFAYIWQFSPNDFSLTTAFGLSMNESENCQGLQMMILIGFPLAAGIIFVLIVSVICLARSILRKKEEDRYESKIKTKTSPVESAPTTYTPLSYQQYEEIPSSTYLSANPQFVASPYESLRRT